MISWPLAFALTLAVETAVLALVAGRGRSWLRVVATAVVANLATHPIVFLVLPRWFSDYGVYLVVAEAFALVVEVPILWLGLRPLPWPRAVMASALANGASYAVGMAVYGLLQG
jgi:hypothetical protein